MMIALTEINDPVGFDLSAESNGVETAMAHHAESIAVNPNHIVTLRDAGVTTEVYLVTGSRIHVHEGVAVILEIME